MSRRWPHLVCLMLLPLACGDSAPRVTVQDGSISQFVSYRSYRVQPPFDFFFVVNTSATNGGTALRSSLADALEARAHAITEGEHWLRDVDNPVDIRAFITNAADESVQSPATTAALAWNQPDATAAGADAFAAAVRDVLLALPDGEAAPGGLVSATESALANAHAQTGRSHAIVVLTSSDDPNASTAKAAGATTRDGLRLAVPARPDSKACEALSFPVLSTWLHVESGEVQTPCRTMNLETEAVEYAADCLPAHAAASADGAPACRVRALVPRGTVCGPERGWRTSTAAVPDNDLGLRAACDIAPLEGADARACRNADVPYEGPRSGWCMPPTTRECMLSSTPRVVKSAAPPFAEIEITCDLR